MRYSFFLLCTLYLLCYSGKTTYAQKVAHHNIAPATDPGSCRIEGKIIRILKPTKEDSGTICHKYPCQAMVKIIEVYGCGSSVSIARGNGETTKMKFAFTLHSTKKIFPTMQVLYPGLKKGDIFIATAVQQLRQGTPGEFIIYDYELK